MRQKICHTGGVPLGYTHRDTLAWDVEEEKMRLMAKLVSLVNSPPWEIPKHFL